MGNCKDCKHWRDGTTYGSPLVRTGTCLATTSFYRRPHGAANTIGDATLALAVDFDNGSAHLQTAPEFGCVQFEAD